MTLPVIERAHPNPADLALLVAGSAEPAIVVAARISEAGRAVLQVSQPHLREAVGFLLGLDSVTDLTIEDPPLEEVMRELFRGSAGGTGDAVAGTAPGAASLPVAGDAA